jgi:hypothetical protein
VTLSINAGNGTLTCTNNAPSAVGGIVNYAGCKITLGTSGTFSLKAAVTSPPPNSGTSSNFTVTP